MNSEENELGSSIEPSSSETDAKLLSSQKITLKIIIDHNLINKNSSETSETTVDSLLKLTHVRLDRCRIDEIDNLAEYLNHAGLTHLYMHHNRIRRIENLDFLVNLTYLNLSHNRIDRVENLKHLSRLQLLDLSSNQIDQPVEHIVLELPLTIAFLDLRDNPVFNEADRESNFKHLKSNLPNLIQLNGDVDIDKERSDVSNDDEGVGNKNKLDKNNDNDEIFAQMKEKILERSRLRHQADRIHMEHDWEQKKLKLNSIEASINEKFRFNKK